MKAENFMWGCLERLNPWREVQALSSRNLDEKSEIKAKGALGGKLFTYVVSAGLFPLALAVGFVASGAYVLLRQAGRCIAGGLVNRKIKPIESYLDCMKDDWIYQQSSDSASSEETEDVLRKTFLNTKLRERNQSQRQNPVSWKRLQLNSSSDSSIGFSCSSDSASSKETEDVLFPSLLNQLPQNDLPNTTTSTSTSSNSLSSMEMQEANTRSRGVVRSSDEDNSVEDDKLAALLNPQLLQQQQIAGDIPTAIHQATQALETAVKPSSSGYVDFAALDNLERVLEQLKKLIDHKRLNQPHEDISAAASKFNELRNAALAHRLNTLISLPELRNQ